MKRCARCVLPETFPGIRFDQEGVCQYCSNMPTWEHRCEQKQRLQVRFRELVSQVTALPGYHCLVSWSGGKDSTCTLWMLKKEYNLRVLAFTFDNGFVSPGAFQNMRVVAENLGIDHVIVKPRLDMLRSIFVASMQSDMYPARALERASAICNSCMALAKGLALRMALEKSIPMLAYGWSPGQIPLASALFHTNPRLLHAMIQASLVPLQKVVGDRVTVCFPEEHHLGGNHGFPYYVSPFAFLDYDEASILRCIQDLGWERPQDTDPNSTNCLLNSFANLVHLGEMGYHPYVMELAGLVREGYLGREEALARLEEAPAPEIVAEVAAKLGVPLS